MTPGRRATQLRAPDLIALAAFLCAAALVIAISARPLATDDTWWHLKLGEVYAAQGPFVDQDPLLHTAQDQATVPHEWLFQIALHGVEQLAGFRGLRVLHGLLVLAITAGVFATFRRVSGSLALAACAATAWLVLSWYRLIQLRPELFSLIALLALAHLLLLRREPLSHLRIAGALGLLLIWVNMHSLFAVGLALLFAAAVASAVEAHGLGTLSRPAARARGRALFATLLAAVVITAINPQGFAQHLTFFTESSSGDIWRLEDDFLRWIPWRPSDDSAALPFLSWISAGLLLVAWTLVAARAGLRLVRERSTEALADADLVGLGLGAAAWVAMLVAARFHWLALFPLITVLAAIAPQRRASWLAATATVALAAALPAAVDLNALRQELTEELGGYAADALGVRYCDNASAFLEDAGLEGRLFHPFNLGGYLGYRHAPRLRTFIDGRLDHVPAGVLDDYIQVRVGVRTSDETRFMPPLDAHGVDLFVGTHFRANRYGQGTWTDHLRRLPEWIPLFASQECSVYLRNEPRNAKNLERAARYYAERDIPFSMQRGPDLGIALTRNRSWSDLHRVTPPDFDALRARGRSDTPEERHRSAEALARGLWRIGAFREQLPIDRALIQADPSEKEPRRRVIDGLLQIGLAAEARPLAEGLLRQDPGYSDIAALHRRVTGAAAGSD